MIKYIGNIVNCIETPSSVLLNGADKLPKVLNIVPGYRDMVFVGLLDQLLSLAHLTVLHIVQQYS